MSRARHEMKREKGGKVEPEIKPKAYDAGDTNVEKEAEEKKDGGRARMKKKDGGKAEHHMEGEHMKKHRMDRPGRKRGGRAGADMHPLSTASKVTSAEGRKDVMSGDADDGP